MKLRNPMKNKWGQWKFDATITEFSFGRVYLYLLE